jgi:hypothetical protein
MLPSNDHTTMDSSGPPKLFPSNQKNIFFSKEETRFLGRYRSPCYSVAAKCPRSATFVHHHDDNPAKAIACRGCHRAVAKQLPRIGDKKNRVNASHARILLRDNLGEMCSEGT